MKAAGDHLKSLGFVEGYADVHAFSQYWMYPYGYGFLSKHLYLRSLLQNDQFLQTN